MRIHRTNLLWSTVNRSNIDALLIIDPASIYYLIGFTGSEALLLLTEKKGYLITDSRYTSQARIECSGIDIIEARCKMEETTKLLRSLRVKIVGHEPDKLTVHQYKKIKNIKIIELVSLPVSLEKIRSKKEAGEIKLLKKSATISSKSFLGILEKIRAGVKESDIALFLEFQIRREGAEDTPFPFIVASGKRGALPHGLASKKKIRRGEFVTIDFGATYQGYCSDETCTVIIGTPTKKQKKIYQVVKDAHDKAIDLVRPGIRAHQVDHTARKIIEKAGLGKYFRHGTGHGVGLTVHEEPRIAPDRDTITEAGMVFTIEPGVYIPGWGGVRIEDMIRVTNQGCELLSSAPKELYIL